MVFNSLTFLAFAAVFFPAFFLARGRLQLLVLLAGSYVFYGWWDWRFLFLLLTSTTVDYTLGRLIESAADDRRRRLLVTLSVAANLGFLGFFKYCNFFAAQAAALLGALGMEADWATLNIVLPVGISFYTFQSMSYTIDVYRRRLPAERDVLVFAAFIALFPQLVAGPIVRATTLLPQIRRERRFRWANLFLGLELAIGGLFMKIVVADNLAPFVAHVFALPQAYNSLTLLLGAVFFAFQIYGDFAGYSLIAIGLARIMGYRFCINFRRPYFAASFSEFWTRWHVSLSSWLRDYLYIPLGGSRGGAARTWRNLMTTMLLGGLWHGASWTFVAWGALHGFYLVGQRWLGALLDRLGLARLAGTGSARFLAILVVFALTTVGWVFFRAATFHEAWTILARIATLGDFGFAAVPVKLVALRGMFLVALLVLVELAAEHRWRRRAPPRGIVARSGAVLAMLWSIALLGSFAGEQFIYFQF